MVTPVLLSDGKPQDKRAGAVLHCCNFRAGPSDGVTALLHFLLQLPARDGAGGTWNYFTSFQKAAFRRHTNTISTPRNISTQTPRRLRWLCAGSAIQFR